MSAMVEASGIGKVYRQGDGLLRVLHEVSLTIEPGELVLLMGPSGSGKTTLLSILAGLLSPDEGEVRLCGEVISGMDQRSLGRVRRRLLGFVFQAYNLFGSLNALDNIAEPLAMKGMKLAAARECARAALESVGLADRAHHLPCDLSGGEKQRVALARAVAGKPRIIFGDEPTAALDGKTAELVLELLRAAVTPQRSILLVTHDHRLEPFADRILLLEDGRLVGK